MKIKVEMTIEDNIIPNKFVVHRIAEMIRDEIQDTGSEAYEEGKTVYCGCGTRLGTITLKGI